MDSDPCAYSSLLLHGRQVPRLLHHHHRLLPRPDRRHLRRLLHRPLPAHRRQGQTHRGLLFPEEVNESIIPGGTEQIDEGKLCGVVSDDGLILMFSESECSYR